MHLLESDKRVINNSTLKMNEENFEYIDQILILREI